MKPWTYDPSPVVHQSIAEQLTVFPREADMTHTVLRTLWHVWLRVFLRVYFRFQLVGRDRIPRQGSYVLVANHASHLDGVSLLAALPLRAVHSTFGVAARDYFFSSFWHSVFSAVCLNALPFNRVDSRRESLELCADVLKAGDRALIMFPEGTRSVTGAIQPFKKGIGILTAGTEWAVVPAYIEGAHAAWPKSSRFPRPRRVRVIIGDPLRFSGVPRTNEGFVRVAREVESAVRQLQQERAMPTPSRRDT